MGMSESLSEPRGYFETRRDEIADEYFAPTYDSMPPHYQPAVEYIVDLERRLHDATGDDVRAEWLARLVGERTAK